MAYYTRILQAGETIRFVGSIHWLIYGHAAGFLLLAAFLALLAAGPAGDWSSLCLVVAAGSAAVAAVAALAAWVKRISTEMIVTDRRVIYKTGLLARRTLEMNVGKIETVDVLQGIPGRLLGYGTVIIRGTGTSFEPLTRVSDPIGLRNAILVG